MARHFAMFYTLAWNDEDWKTLSRNAQGTYQMLISQMKISAAGVLDLTLKRWSDNSSDPVEVLQAAIDELTERRYILVDHGSEELLVRTFIRWDKGYSSPTRRVAVVAAASAVHSSSLRSEVHRQMGALAQEFGPFGDGPHGWPAPAQRPANSPSDTPSDTPSQAPSQTAGPGASQAQGPTHRLPSSTDLDHQQTGDGRSNREPGAKNREPGKQQPAAATAAKRASRQRDELFEALCEECGVNSSELTASLRGAVNRALKEIRDVGGTPGQVKVRANRFKQRYREVTLTPTALAKHWPQLSQADRQPSASGGGW